jgi:hypothetical protein
MSIWNILWIFCDHSVHIVLIWYIFSCFGIIHHGKSGNPASKSEQVWAAEYSKPHHLSNAAASAAATRFEQCFFSFRRKETLEMILELVPGCQLKNKLICSCLRSMRF